MAVKKDAPEQGAPSSSPIEESIQPSTKSESTVSDYSVATAPQATRQGFFCLLFDDGDRLQVSHIDDRGNLTDHSKPLTIDKVGNFQVSRGVYFRTSPFADGVTKGSGELESMKDQDAGPSRVLFAELDWHDEDVPEPQDAVAYA